MAAFIRTHDHLTVVYDDGQTDTIYNDNPRYNEIIAAMNVKDWETVRKLSRPINQVKESIARSSVGTSGRTEVIDGVVWFDGEPLHNTLADRIVDMIDQGFDVEPLILFLENLMENPSYRAVEQLYGFLEKSALPITEDGHFLAYKRITTDWKDEYTKKIDNSIGATPTVPRNTVDEDPDNTCSNGLHFCSREYLPYYGSNGGGRVVMIKINPRDVVAIPRDYNNAKGRCCRYEVVRELELESKSSKALPTENLEGGFRDTGTRAKGTARVLQQIDPNCGVVVATFASPTDAMKATGIDSSGISKVARGVRNTAGGFEWRYDWAPVEMTSLDDGVKDPLPPVSCYKGGPVNKHDYDLPELDDDYNEWDYPD